MKLPANTKPWVQGAVVGAAVMWIAGFQLFGWYTGGTHDKDVAAARSEGRVAALAPICASSLASSPDFAKIKATTSSWERRTMVEKTGFATPAGSTSADSDLADACAAIAFK